VAHRRPDVVVATGGTRVPADPSLTDLNVLAVYERRFGKRTMWEVAVPLASHDTAGLARRQGIGDIEVAIKHVIAARADAPRILSAGLEVSLPTGSAVRGLGRGRTMLEPYLAAGALVANTYLQGQSKLELPADGARTGRAVVYNIYAGRDTSKAPDTWTLGLELNGENRELALTPQVRKGLTKTGALGAALGVRFPITQRRVQGTRVVSYVLWEYLEPVKARR
jgi:hypothetical protein